MLRILLIFFLLPISSYSVNCDKLFKDEGYICNNSNSNKIEGEINNIEYSIWHHTSYFDNKHDYQMYIPSVNIYLDPDDKYKKIEFHFGYYDRNFNLLYERIVDDSFVFGYRKYNKTYTRKNYKNVAPGYNEIDAFISKNFKPLKSKNSLVKKFKGKIKKWFSPPEIVYIKLNKIIFEE